MAQRHLPERPLAHHTEPLLGAAGSRAHPQSKCGSASRPNWFLVVGSLLWQVACLQATPVELGNADSERLGEAQPNAQHSVPTFGLIDKTTIEQPINQPSTTDMDPQNLLGHDREGIAELLGPPRIVRRDTPVEIWQYYGSDCILDVFFYDNNVDFHVKYIEARDWQAAEFDAQICLQELLELLRVRRVDQVG